MKHLLLFVFSISLIVTACKNNTTPTAVEGDMTYYGEKITADGVMTYDEMLTKLETSDSLTNIKVIGKIDGVCQAKGCWMNIVSDKNPEAESMFVKFKDYGFFMPKDIAGRDVIVEGRAYKEITPVDELRHYAEDEGLPEEDILAINEPKEELKFMAHGVILLD